MILAIFLYGLLCALLGAGALLAQRRRRPDVLRGTIGALKKQVEHLEAQRDLRRLLEVDIDREVTTRMQIAVNNYRRNQEAWYDSGIYLYRKPTPQEEAKQAEEAARLALVRDYRNLPEGER